MAGGSRGRFATVDEIGERLERGVEQVAIAFVLELDRLLRMSPRRGGTPVLTGHARANWVPSVAQPYTGETPEADDSAHDSGLADVLSYRLGRGNLWVANNASYIRRLNDGWSKQAPAGFIERAIDIALQTIERKFGKGALGVSGDAFRNQVGGEMAGNLADAYSPFGGD